MKQILFITLIAWSLAMQASSGAEPFDSLSYAIGDYYTRIVAENEPKLQSQADREEYVLGLQEGIRFFNQDSTAAEYYGKGLEVGGYIMMMMNNGSGTLKQDRDLNCIIEGVNKVIDGNIILPQDTIGIYDFMLHIYGMKDDNEPLNDEDNCRLARTFGVMMALYPDQIGITDQDLSGRPDSIALQRRYATGIAHAIKAYNNYNIGLVYAYMVWSLGAVEDFDAWLSGIRCALGLDPRKMTIEQVEQCITAWQIKQSEPAEEMTPEEYEQIKAALEAVEEAAKEEEEVNGD